MFRLGVRLTIRSGREALVRLILTSMAVAIGVAVLLTVFAYYHAYQAASNRPSWESTAGQQFSGQEIQSTNSELWNYSENIYKGKFIEQLDVASLGTDAPIVPGLQKLPASGQYYASPALANLLRTVPRDELGNRFPGTQVGTIGEKGLSFPTELAIIIGYPPSQLKTLPGTVLVNRISTSPQLQGTTNIYRIAFGIGAIAVLFPLLILINTATRLAASRREERYAALRLIGATRRQINLIASVDASISALAGAILGVVIFLILRSAMTGVAFSGVKFFADTVTPTTWGYVLLLIGVPITATVSSLISLYRVQISPLGVSRKTTPPPPRLWRLIPLVIGVPLFIAASSVLSDHINNGNPHLILLGFVLIMFGLVLSGSWLTMQIATILGKFVSGAATLLASRRLSDSPKVAFRSVSGLVLAVFVGSVIAVVVPAINAAQSPINSASITNVLRMTYNFTAEGASSSSEASSAVHVKPDGPPPSAGQNAQLAAPPVTGMTISQSSALIKKLQAFPGTYVIPIYDSASYQNVMDCSTLKTLPVLGKCPTGIKYVSSQNLNNLLFTDNPLYVNKALPLVDSSTPGTSKNLTGLYMQGMLIKTKNADTLEQVRTYLTNYDMDLSINGGSGLSGWQMGDLEPETFGEIAQIRNNDDTNAEHVVLAIIALTILVAGCSLAVTVGGSLVERRRPFTLLRLSGCSIRTLYKVIILEAALPLLLASVAAAAIGINVSIPVINSLLTSLSPSAKSFTHPQPIYYVMVGAGLVISLVLIALTLPILKRLTKPEDARFE